MARACQYSSVCTDKGGKEEKEPARHWIMQVEKVDGVTGRAGHRGEREPFHVLFSHTTTQQASVSTTC